MSVPREAGWRTALSQESHSLAAVFHSTHRHLHVVVRQNQTTILPPTPRPTGRLPRGLCRYNARHVEARNDRNIESSIEPNDDANDDGFIFWSNVASNAWCSDGLRLRFRSRFSAGFSCRRSCRRSSLHSERYLDRYFLTNNERYFERPNCVFSARFQ